VGGGRKLCEARLVGAVQQVELVLDRDGAGDPQLVRRFDELGDAVGGLVAHAPVADLQGGDTWP
jgi:hypothetical protein